MASVHEQSAGVEQPFAARRKPNRRPSAVPAGAPVGEEQRQARAAQRNLQRARAQRTRDAQARRRKLIAEVLATPAGKRCRCGITPRITDEELRALGAGCTAGRWVCEVLQRVRRRVGL